MAPVGIFLPYLWRAFRRDIRSARSWQGANLVVALFFGQFAAIRIWVVLSAGARKLTDDLDGGTRLATLAMGEILLLWMVVPFVTSISSLRRGVFPPDKLRHLPIETSTLSGIAAASAFVHPVYWVMFVATVFSLLPVSFPFGPSGVAGTLLFILDAVLIAWLIGIFIAAGSSSRRQLEISALASAIAPLLLLTFLIRGFRQEIEVGDRLLSVLGYTPAGWTVAAWTGKRALTALALLAFLAFFCVRIGTWRLRTALLEADSVGRDRLRLRFGERLTRWIGAPHGALLARELAYLTRNLDTQITFGLAIGATLLFSRTDQVYLWIPLLALPVFAVSELAIWTNSFGLDQRGVDRYRLLPISGADVIRAKNSAAGLVLLVQAFLLAAAVALRGHPIEAGALLAGALGLHLWLCLAGNELALRFPSPREFFHWDNLTQIGGPIAVFASLILCAFGVGVVLLCAPGGPIALLAGQLGWAALAALLLRLRSGANALRFDSSGSEMRARLGRER
ncbi:MAG: hypothetical protein IT349_19830 [Candidatus Eisenbacteria bacterium]|nr:hypothetical protein [Candidatus Eisenbacteria bacterium]